MRVSRRALAAVTAASCLIAAGSAAAYHTQFVANNCNYNDPSPTSYITRDGSTTVALRARFEGYQWAGRHYALTHYETDRVCPRIAGSRESRRELHLD